MKPIAPDIPDFPLAREEVMPLRRAALARGSADFVPLWSGQAASLGKELPAGELTKKLAEGIRRLLTDE